MRSRHKAKIEPIHIQELLNGAGMRGFLSVLDRPVPTPHLRGLGSCRETGGTAGEESLRRLSARAEALLGQFVRQERALRAIAEIACRIHGGATALQRGAAVVRDRRAAAFVSQKRGVG